MKTIVVSMALILFLLSAFAQEVGSIKGKVLDKATKQPLIGVNILVVGTTLGASTDNNGQFIISQLKEDVYKLRLTYIGYTPSLRTDVRVVRNKTTNIEVELEEDYIQGEEVTVTANPFQINKEAPVSNYTYSKEEINRSPGATGDIFRAIETLPGVSSSGGEFSAFSVRGGSPRENIVLVDNIPMDQVTHFDGGSEEQESQGGRFSIFAPNLIQEANFQAGGFRARYGGKNASFVDMKIKEGNQDNFTINGTYDLLGWEFNYDGPSYISNSTSLIVSARGRDFRRVLEMTGQRDLGDPGFTDIILKTTTNVDARNKVSFLGIYSPEKFKRTINHVYESKNLYWTELDDVEETKSVVGLNWQMLSGEKSFLQNTLYYKGRDAKRDFGRAFTDPVNGVVPAKEQAAQRKNIYNKNGKETEFGWKSAFTYIFSKSITSTAGIDVSSIRFEYTAVQNGADTVYTYDQNDYRPSPAQKYIVRLPEYVNAKYEQTKFNFAAYADLLISLGDMFVLNPGLRFERSEFNRKSYVSPRVSASYAPDPKTRINLATGVYYQTPSTNINTTDPSNLLLLNNERAVHAVLGVTRYLSDDIKLTVEGYYKSLDDLIVRIDRTSERRINFGDGWASGVDVSLVKRFVDKFYGQLNYSYAQSKRNDNDGRSEYDSDFNQPHIFNILVGYELNKEWAFSAKWKYATGRPTHSYIVNANVFNNPEYLRYSKEITRRNGRRLDNFHTLNVRVDYRMQFGWLAIVSFVDVLNVYGRLNVNEERFLERSGEVIKEGFEMIPTIGVKLEF